MGYLSVFNSSKTTMTLYNKDYLNLVAESSNRKSHLFRLPEDVKKYVLANYFIEPTFPSEQSSKLLTSLTVCNANFLSSKNFYFNEWLRFQDLANDFYALSSYINYSDIPIVSMTIKEWSNLPEDAKREKIGEINWEGKDLECCLLYFIHMKNLFLRLKINYKKYLNELKSYKSFYVYASANGADASIIESYHKTSQAILVLPINFWEKFNSIDSSFNSCTSAEEFGLFLKELIRASLSLYHSQKGNMGYYLNNWLILNNPNRKG